MNWRRLHAALVGLVLVLPVIISPAAGVETPDEQFSLIPFQYPSGAEYQGVQIRDNEVPGISVLIGRVKQEGQNALEPRICGTSADPNCNQIGTNFSAVVPVCTDVLIINCIADLQAIGPDGKVVIGTHANERIPMSAVNEFPADPARDLPQGSTPSVWRLDGVPHGGGTTEYLVTAMVRGEQQQGTSFTFTDFNMTIAAFSRKTGDYAPSKYMDKSMRGANDCPDSPTGCNMALVGGTGADTTACASIANGFCALREKLPLNTRFKLTLRLSQSPTGWFHGRVKQPEINLKPVAQGVEVTVAGEPVQVPIVATIAKYANLPSEIQALYPQNRFDGASWGDPGPNNRRNRLSVPDPDSDSAFKEFAAWARLIGDQASASPSIWTMRTLKVPNDANGCFRDTKSLLGIVTTNSMIYSPGPPTFNSTSGTLDYRLTSPHLTSRGEVFSGTYDLAMKSSVARCVYGFSSAPISASVSIVSADGNAQVATTSVSERDDWLHLAAAGFTFSSPTVRVKLSQAKPASSTVSSVTAKPKAVTCVKGKTTKKFVGAKCPRGWRKR